jgi:hypothetical protein
MTSLFTQTRYSNQPGKLAGRGNYFVPFRGQAAVANDRTGRIPIAGTPAFAGFSYGQFGKKFASKVAGEVLQSPAPGADTVTFV